MTTTAVSLASSLETFSGDRDVCVQDNDRLTHPLCLIAGRKWQRVANVTGPMLGSKGASERHPEARHRSVQGGKPQSDLSSSLTR